MLLSNRLAVMKLVSVIIPCYNVEQYISQCLKSVVGQTYTNLQIICIDDGSQDGTLEILENFRFADQRITIISQENQGIAFARNQGLLKAEGDFVMFVDSDDWLDLDTIMRVFKNYDNQDLIIFSYEREFKNGSLPKDLNLQGEYKAAHIQRRLLGPIQQEMGNLDSIDALAPVWGKVYKKEILPENIIFKALTVIGTWEDGFFNLEVLENAKNVLIINEPLYHYRKFNSTSYTSSYKENLQKKWFVKFKLLESFLHNHNKDQRYNTALNNRICITFLGLCLNEMNYQSGIFSLSRKVKILLNIDFYRTAFSRFELKYLSLHWKIFYYFAKIRFSFGVSVMTYFIYYFINRKNQ